MSSCFVNRYRTLFFVFQTLGLIILLNLSLSSCASYSVNFKQIETKIAQKNYPAALKTLDDNKGPQRNSVLYWMNRGMILRMSGNYTQSNQALEQAKTISQQIAATSVSEQAGALSINDGLRSYEGQSFEKIYLNVYKILNYLEQNDLQNARVEALQIDVKFNEMNDDNFKDDPFARYLMGIVFEAQQEWSNALIAYRKAYDNYQSKQKVFSIPLPKTLQQDLLRLTAKENFKQEHQRYAKRFKNIKWPKASEFAQKGELIIIFHNSLMPAKGEQSISSAGKKGILVRISTPFYQRKPVHIRQIKVKTHRSIIPGNIVEDLAAVGQYTLAHQTPAIIARAITRAVVKTSLTSELEKKNELAGIVASIAGLLTERADTRAWSTLPQNIHIARIPLSPGKYKVDVQLLGYQNNIIHTEKLTNLNIRKGKKIFKNIHFISAR